MLIKLITCLFQVNTLQEECEKMGMNVSNNVGTNKMQEESMDTEKMLKVQAINKLQD